MPLYRGNRATSGDGTAVVTAAAGFRLKLSGFFKVQALEAGPITLLLKCGSTTVYSAYMVDSGDGELITEFPLIYSGEAEALYVNLSAAKSVDYAIEVESVGTGRS